MARTSRNGVPAANVDALDNLNLDDMFADGGDILFDGLDIDLENMDDITSTQDGNKKSEATVPLAPPAPAPAAGATTVRRRTPRTSRAPFPYRDDDDEEYTEEPARKKKKSKAGSPKRKISKKSSSNTSTPLSDELSKAGAKSKRGKVAASSMPPPVARPTSAAPATPAAAAAATATSVAASGQFGGRQKRGNSVTSKVVKVKTSLPTVVDSRPKSRSSTSPSPATSTTVANLSQVKATHPGLMQSDFCGMMPSRTAFYPFMSCLPSEPALKNRKLYALIDRIHSSFLGHLSSAGKPSGGINPAQQSEPIFQLIQEAYKHEKPVAGATLSSRVEIIGNSIGVLRRTISMFDRARLAGDMFALCALLKRQHDFLKQNSENMKLWCKDNLPDSEFASVYLSPKKDKKKAALPLPVQMSVLASFTTAEIKVKVICNGVKEQKQPLVAMLQIFMPGMASGTPKVGSTSSKSKKRKLASVTVSSESQSSPPRALPVVNETKGPKPSYAELAPNKRRRVVGDMISQAVRSIEVLKSQKEEDYYFALTQYEADARRVAEEDVPMIHTTGMWQWIEKAGFFNPISRPDIFQRLESFLPDRISGKEQSAETTDRLTIDCDDAAHGTPIVENQSVQERLRSLLLEDDVTDSETSNNDDFSIDDYEVATPGRELTSESVMHLLSEPFKLNLISLGSVLQNGVLQNGSRLDDTRKRRNDTVARSNGRKDEDLEVCEQFLDTFDGLDEITHVMKLDLHRLDTLNRKRAGFLENYAVLAETTPQQSKHDLEQEAALISKYQQVLKKSREMAKSGKSKPSSDRFAIPW